VICTSNTLGVCVSIPGGVVHMYTRASVMKQYNLVPSKGRQCSVAGKITAGLLETSGSLLLDLRIHSPAG